MKIAVLGWGSLVNNPGKLDIKNSWYENGPFLPIEFSRVSSDGRLTLVITPGVDQVQSLWAWISTKYLDRAIEDLGEREGPTSRENIGYIQINPEKHHSRFSSEILNSIRNWAIKEGMEAVIWTDLPSNFQEKAGMTFEAENVIRYLKGLPPEKKGKAEEYIREAPTQTKIRKVIEETLGWTPFRAKKKR